MKNVLISLPEKLATRMREVLPRRERSQTIAQLLAIEIRKREKCLIQDTKDWEVTLNDGLGDETW